MLTNTDPYKIIFTSNMELLESAPFSLVIYNKELKKTLYNGHTMYHFKFFLLIIFIKNLTNTIGFISILKITTSKKNNIVFSHNNKFEQNNNLINTLILSGGGAKGVSLIGVSETLEEFKIIHNIQNIAGTSAGAIFGALVCFGMTSRELHEFVKQDGFEEILGKKLLCGKNTLPLITKSGNPIYDSIKKTIKDCILYKIPSLLENFNEHIRIKSIYLKALKNQPITFKDLYILNLYFPKTFKNFYTNAIDIKTGNEIIFSYQLTPEVEIASACRGSASVPVILRPHNILIGKKKYHIADGGLSCNTPFHIVPNLKGNNNIYNTLIVELEKSNYDFIEKKNFIAFLKKIKCKKNTLKLINNHAYLLDIPNKKQCPKMFFLELMELLEENFKEILSFIFLNFLGQINLKISFFEQKKITQQKILNKYPNAKMTLNFVKINFLDFNTAKTRSHSIKMIGQIETVFFLYKSNIVSEKKLINYLKGILLLIDERININHKKVNNNIILTEVKKSIENMLMIENSAIQNTVISHLIYNIKVFLETNLYSYEAKIIGGDHCVGCMSRNVNLPVKSIF